MYCVRRPSPLYLLIFNVLCITYVVKIEIMYLVYVGLLGCNAVWTCREHSSLNTEAEFFATPPPPQTLLKSRRSTPTSLPLWGPHVLYCMYLMLLCELHVNKCFQLTNSNKLISREILIKRYFRIFCVSTPTNNAAQWYRTCGHGNNSVAKYCLVLNATPSYTSL
jgi:hypothetical protein